MKVFIDSDVIIASFLSSSGASYYLLHKTETITSFISQYSQKELQVVMQRLDIPSHKLSTLEKVHVIHIQGSHDEVKKTYSKYVLDEYDAHIVAGAVQAKAKFLITYNTKDFKSDVIKDAFGCIITTPANFLQYLRSI